MEILAKRLDARSQIDGGPMTVKSSRASRITLGSAMISASVTPGAVSARLGEVLHATAVVIGCMLRISMQT